jgi:hypothetical protein
MLDAAKFKGSTVLEPIKVGAPFKITLTSNPYLPNLVKSLQVLQAIANAVSVLGEESGWSHQLTLHPNEEERLADKTVAQLKRCWHLPCIEPKTKS